VKNIRLRKLDAIRAVALALLALTLGSCASKAQARPRTTVMSEPSAAENTGPATGGAGANSAQALAQSYLLGPGDKLRVIVFQEPDLSGEFEVDSAGMVSLPLIEPISAQGMTIGEFQSAIAAKLSAGYLVNPRVSAEVLNYRPFYITGEVNRPGEYPYVAGMNILKAIAMAGGTTYRANTKRIYLTRGKEGKESVVEPTPDVIIMPGDFIRIPERFF
jgi:polysaccharide export outer membrane protein